MFPKATAYRSIVRTVDDRARDEVGTRLPFELHYSELGRHTLYVPVREEMPLGIVHVRSEQGEWGLIEIAWAFEVHLRVVDFQFQRCRDPKRSVVESEAFRDQIVGRDYAQLHRVLKTGSGEDTRHGLNVSHDASALAAAVLRARHSIAS